MNLKLILGLALILFIPLSNSFASGLSTNSQPQKLIHNWKYITFPLKSTDGKSCPGFLCGYDAHDSQGVRVDIMDIMPGFLKANLITARLYRADGEIVEPTLEGKKLLNDPISINTAISFLR